MSLVLCLNSDYVVEDVCSSSDTLKIGACAQKYPLLVEVSFVTNYEDEFWKNPRGYDLIQYVNAVSTIISQKNVMDLNIFSLNGKYGNKVLGHKHYSARMGELARKIPVGYASKDVFIDLNEVK